MAPVDMFNALNKTTIESIPDFLMSPDLKASAFDVKIHWVNETGKTARLSSGMTVQATVSI